MESKKSFNLTSLPKKNIEETRKLVNLYQKRLEELQLMAEQIQINALLKKLKNDS